MAKKSAKIAATYFITIFAALAVVGGTSFFMLRGYIFGDSDKPAAPGDPDETQTSVTTSSAEYVPSDLDSRTVIGIYDAGSKPSSTCFVLFRFLPSQNKLVVVPLQPGTVTSGGGTLYDLYRSGGAQAVKRGLETLIGFPVDKYIALNDNNFGTFSNLCGNISFNIPYNLIYESEDAGENTVLKAGEQMLDNKTLRKVLIFPVYTGGEEYRATIVGEIVCGMMDNGAKGIFKSAPESVYTELANSGADMDISIYDYRDSEQAIKYVLDRSSSPSQLVIPSGTYTDGGYVLDDAFIDALPRYFGME